MYQKSNHLTLSDDLACSEAKSSDTIPESACSIMIAGGWVRPVCTVNFGSDDPSRVSPASPPRNPDQDPPQFRPGFPLGSTMLSSGIPIRGAHCG